MLAVGVFAILGALLATAGIAWFAARRRTPPQAANEAAVAGANPPEPTAKAPGRDGPNVWSLVVGGGGVLAIAASIYGAWLNDQNADEARRDERENRAVE